LRRQNSVQPSALSNQPDFLAVVSRYRLNVETQMPTHLIIFEDEHLLVINKPAGMNTHSPGPFAGEGIYEWLKNREPRWANLAIIHRLDKETSGAIVFGKTTLANRSLTAQFAERKVSKKYFLLTDRKISFDNLKAESVLVRAGEKYLSRPMHSGGERAKTHFRKLESNSGRTVIEAEPITGKTHQIRVHAAEHGFPILGDALYGGTPAGRVFLHAAEISFEHPATRKSTTFVAREKFSDDARMALRAALIDSESTNAFRLIHGAPDGWPNWYVERLGDFLLSQSEQPLKDEQIDTLKTFMKEFSSHGVYHKILNRRVRQVSSAEASPQLILGEAAPDEFVIRENGVQFALGFKEGYSVGLFLDQRENRRRFLTNYIAPEFSLHQGPGEFTVLNTFAYTCGFSVCAAKSGAKVTSLDLSKKYLEWGKRNFVLNGLDPAQHDFIFGDTFDWLKRLSKKNRQFDVIILDPPTFSYSKEQGTFRAEKDFGKLVSAALPLIKPNGILFASSNAATWSAEDFLQTISRAVTSGKRKVVQQHYVPQPPDFPIQREEPAYLKTVWLRIG
jgi:23S rRNA (cytosine1962-C5)-methyltransferase